MYSHIQESTTTDPQVKVPINPSRSLCCLTPRPLCCSIALLLDPSAAQVLVLVLIQRQAALSLLLVMLSAMAI